MAGDDILSEELETDREGITNTSGGTVADRQSGEQAVQPDDVPDVAVGDIPDAVIVADSESGRIIEVNAAAGELFGCDPMALCGRLQTDLHPSGEEDAYRQAFTRGIAGERVNRLADGSPLFIETASGEQVPVEINVKRVETETGMAIVGVFRDASEQIDREQQLQKTTTRLETLLDALPIPVAVIDTDGIVRRWNPATERILGYDAAEIRGEPYSLFVDEAEFEQVFADVIAGQGVGGYTTTLRAADGSVVPVELYAHPLFEDGSVTGVIGVAIDRTDQRERQQQLSVLHRVLRHNLRNDVNAIMGWTTQLTAETEAEQKAINRIGQAVDRLAALSADAAEIRQNITGDTTPVESVTLKTAQAKLTEQLSPNGTVRVDNVAFPDQVTVPRRGIDAVSNLLGDFECERYSVTPTSGTEYVRIDIVTPGCALPDGAQALIIDGKETKLEHANDLTAAKALLTINSVGGSVVPTDEVTADTESIYIDLPRTDD